MRTSTAKPERTLADVIRSGKVTFSKNSFTLCERQDKHLRYALALPLDAWAYLPPHRKLTGVGLEVVDVGEWTGAETAQVGYCPDCRTLRESTTVQGLATSDCGMCGAELCPPHNPSGGCTGRCATWNSVPLVGGERRHYPACQAQLNPPFGTSTHRIAS